MAPVHKKQLTTYLRLSGKRLGLLINFGEELIKNGITRIVNGLPDERPQIFFAPLAPLRETDLSSYF